MGSEMSNRNLMHYFSPSVSKLGKSKEDEEKNCEIITLSPPSPMRCPKPVKSNVSPESLDVEKNDENDEILPLPLENSIKRYFTPVDRNKAANRPRKDLCLVTVKAQIHGSPKKIPKPLKSHAKISRNP